MDKEMKMLRITFVLLAMLVLPLAQAADDGLISKQSPHSVSITLDRLEAVLKTKGITIFRRVDHAAGAKKVGMELRPTQLLIFGNPKLGSPLMQSNQTVGIDLPMKALAWEDADGQVWLTYNDPAWTAARHSIADRDEVITNMSGALDTFTNKAVEVK
jgi:uncharacterized protein (DUF302 family)